MALHVQADTLLFFSQHISNPQLQICLDKLIKQGLKKNKKVVAGL